MKKINPTFHYLMFTLCLLHLSMGTLRAQNEISGYTFAGMYNNHYYYISDCTSNLFNALSAAQEMGGYLVALSDMDENAFVTSLVSPNGAWLGMFYPYWLNGESLTFENWDSWCDVCDYLFAAIYPNGYWRPDYSGALFQYIIEFDTNPDCNNPNKQYVCHNGNTICVNNSSVQSHLNHGDYLGPCGGCNDPNSFQAPVMEPVQPDQNNVRVVSAEPVEREIISKQDRSLHVFPNPSQDEFILKFSSSSDSPAIIRVFDIFGKLVLSDKFAGTNPYRFGKDLYPGIYFVEINTGTDRSTQKVLKTE
ncbi:MAG TPA: T9SS type A sorting domain-containing protein [Saprospiraceae bacterium]|nr:T9SS type A sorting domain-containing protein [Saprospiraceae bacterium]